MTNSADAKARTEWWRIYVLWSLIPVLVAGAFVWDCLHTSSISPVAASDSELLSARRIPVAVKHFFGEAYRIPQNLDFSETDSIGYPRYWHFPSIQMLDGYRIDSKSRVDGKPSLHIDRNAPTDAPPIYKGFTLSQVWDVQSWKETSLSVEFHAGFVPKATSPDAKAYVSIIAYPRKGGDPSIFRQEIASASELEPYSINVNPTTEMDWMVCSIMMVGDGELKLHSLALSKGNSVDPNEMIPVETPISSHQGQGSVAGNQWVGLGLIGLGLGFLVLSYRDGYPALRESYGSAKAVWDEWLRDSCFEASNAIWNGTQLILLRVAFVYYFVLPFAESFLSLAVRNFSKRQLDFYTGLASQFGLEVKRYDGIAMGNTIDAMKVMTNLGFAVLVATVWWILTRKAANYCRLHELLRLTLRYSLFFGLFPYGTAKIFLAQFPKPSDEMLAMTLGGLRPSGLMWAFFGTSDAFNWIAGGLECMACGLLLFRRTVLAGSLLSIILLANVVVLDFCYGIEVAVFASMMLMQAVVLVGPDISRLVRFLFGNASIEPSSNLPFSRHHWTWVGTRAFKLWIVGLFCYSVCMADYRRGSLAVVSKNIHAISEHDMR